MHTSGTTNKELRKFMARNNTEINRQSLALSVLRQV